jgi:hypothetical protein
MKLQDTHYKNEETKCCAPLDVEHYNEKEFHFEGQRFLKGTVISFFHIPLTINSVMTRLVEKADAVEAYPEFPFWLSDEKGLFAADLLLAVDRDIPGAEIVLLSGTFLTKTFEGPYSKMGSWIAEMKKYVESKGKKVKKLYFYYATCPKCAKHYGKNQTVIFAEVE